MSKLFPEISEHLSSLFPELAAHYGYKPANLSAQPTMRQAETPEEMALLAGPAQSIRSRSLEEIGSLAMPGESPIERNMVSPIDIAAMTAFHGTPHKFPPVPGNPLGKFDLSKIGTGEGAQSYGHGIYVAENPGVAKGYQRTLSGEGSIEVRGVGAKLPSEFKSKVMSGKFSEEDLDAFAATVAQNFRDIPTDSKDRAASTLITAARKWFGTDFPIAVEDVLDNYARGLKPSDIVKKRGAFYTVDLPDEQIAKMLDWDKPLSQQAPEVRSAIKKAGFTEGEILEPGQDVTGKEIYNVLTEKMYQTDLADMKSKMKSAKDLMSTNRPYADPQKAASEYLNSLGIPGIKYLDQGSRAAGNGTRNFVIFDPDIAKIVGKK